MAAPDPDKREMKDYKPDHGRDKSDGKRDSDKSGEDGEGQSGGEGQGSSDSDNG